MNTSFLLCLTADEIGFPLLDPYDSFRIDGKPRSSTPICVTNFLAGIDTPSLGSTKNVRYPTNNAPSQQKND